MKNARINTLWLSLSMRYKNFVNGTTPIENVEIPRFRIEQALQQIRETPGTIQSVTGSMTGRLQVCLEMQGSRFEHLLRK